MTAEVLQELPAGWQKHEGQFQKMYIVLVTVIAFACHINSVLIDLYNIAHIVYYIFADDLGAYYWHIKSGTIQRDLPTEEDGITQPAVVNGERVSAFVLLFT